MINPHMDYGINNLNDQVPYMTRSGSFTLPQTGPVGIQSAWSIGPDLVPGKAIYHGPIFIKNGDCLLLLLLIECCSEGLLTLHSLALT